MMWTPEQQAYCANEWARGRRQRTIAEQYRVSTSVICNAIGDFLRMIFPGDWRLLWAGGEARRKLAQEALALWLAHGRVFVEPPARDPIKRYRLAPVFRTKPPHRPIDMGGPRDVWLVFYPPPDPRLDNMVPVSASEIG